MIRNIALVPFRPVLGDPGANIAAMAEEVEKQDSAELVLFPELSTSGYLLERLVREASLKIDDALFKPLLDLSQKKEIVFGAAIREGHCFYNATLAFSGGEVIHVHRKVYLPTYGMFDEGRYFCTGGSMTAYDGVLGKTAVLVCEDAWHPALAYAHFARGVEHVLVPSASPSRGISSGSIESLSSREGWKRRLHTYAESFGQYYYYVNLNTVEDGVTFGGETFVVSPVGTLHADEKPGKTYLYGVDEEEFIIAAQRGGPFQDERFPLNLDIIARAGEDRLYDKENF